MRNVNVTHFEASPLAVQAARAEGGKTTLVHQHGERVGLVNHLRQLGATKEEVDGARDGLGVHQVGDLANFIGGLDAHALLDGSTQLGETLPEFINRQLVQRSQTTVGQVVDVIDVRGLVLSTQLQHVLDDLEEVLGTDVHDGLVDILVELAVHTEATNLAQSVLVFFVETFREEFSSLVDLRRVARTKPTINLQERRFVLGDLGEEVKLLFSNRVQDQRIDGWVDHPKRIQARRQDGLEGIAEGGASLGQELTGFLINDVFCGVVLGGELGDIDIFDVIKGLENAIGGREGWHHFASLAFSQRIPQRPQERGGRNLGRLIDLHAQDVFLGDFQFDPGATLGDDLRRVQRTVVEGLGNREVDTRRSVQLGNDDPHGTIDDEFTTAEHHGNVTQVDVFGHVLFTALHDEANGDAQRQAVGQTKFTTLQRGVARLLQVVLVVLNADLLVVRDNREDFSEEPLQSDGFSLVGGNVLLKKLLVSACLKFRQIWNFNCITKL